MFILANIFPENYNSLKKMNELALFSDENYQPKYYQINK